MWRHELEINELSRNPNEAVGHDGLEEVFLQLGLNFKQTLAIHQCQQAEDSGNERRRKHNLIEDQSAAFL